jgi:hypothetical protein
MPPQKTERSKKTLRIVLSFLLALIIIAAGWMIWQRHDKAPLSEKISQKTAEPVKPEPVIDFGRMEKDEKVQELIRERKETYGVNDGVDLIVKADESIRVGDSTVSMREILEKIRLKKGDIIENDIQAKGGGKQFQEDVKTGPAVPEEEAEAYGIYVVQGGDNIWNIHFRFLKYYFDRKGVQLSPFSDEPDRRGCSSGVGKILKFSENVVYIYNIREHKLDVNLDMIQPLSKIVVFNMAEVFALLDRIDYRMVNRIQFDGETLWIPAEQ